MTFNLDSPADGAPPRVSSLDPYNWGSAPAGWRSARPFNVTPVLPGLVVVESYMTRCRSSCCEGTDGYPLPHATSHETRVEVSRETIRTLDGFECVPQVVCIECETMVDATVARPYRGYGRDSAGDCVCDVCADDASDIRVCHDCDCATSEDETREGPDGNAYCEDCATGFGSCESCDAIHWDDDLHATENGTVLCSDCSWSCDDCSSVYRSGSSRYAERQHTVTDRRGGTETVCSSCYEGGSYFHCAGCEEGFTDSCASGSNDDGTFCESCWEERGGDDSDDASAPAYAPARNVASGRVDPAKPLAVVPFDGTVATVPNGRTFGVEVECRLAGTPAGWDRHDDGSLRSESGEWEVVSPIHSGTLGIRKVYGALDAMREAGSHGVERGGVHVHCGVKDLTLGQLANVYDNWEAWGEDTFSGFVPAFRWASRWCASTKGQGFASYIRRNFQTRLNETVADHRHACLTGTSERYWSLNPLAIDRHTTLECRLFPSDCDPARVSSWAALVVRFVDVARDLDATKVRELCQRFGTYRVGARLLSRGCDFLATFLRSEWERLHKDGALSIDMGAHDSRDPWGKRRKAERKAKRSRSSAPASCAVCAGPRPVDCSRCDSCRTVGAAGIGGAV